MTYLDFGHPSCWGLQNVVNVLHKRTHGLSFLYLNFILCVLVYLHVYLFNMCA